MSLNMELVHAIISKDNASEKLQAQYVMNEVFIVHWDPSKFVITKSDKEMDMGSATHSGSLFCRWDVGKSEILHNFGPTLTVTDLRFYLWP